ncbi:protein phosphatase 2C domain-containing protein [Nonomuraea sp. H19]|uniref:protein phosphatase 2C domain-containing protein n=1 Tax=Nonomuraea sp. H19 TaxID=3452206 RepID=UPI003F8A9980
MKFLKRLWPGTELPRPAGNGRAAAPCLPEPVEELGTPAGDEPLVHEPVPQARPAPPEPGDAPAEVRNAPAEVRNAPAEVRNAPAEVRNAPAEVRNAPAEVRNAPAEVRNAPAEVRDAPADLPTDAPAIGRVSAASLGVLGTGCRLRPPAVAVDGTTAGIFHVAAASIMGAGHMHGGQPRQDAYNVMLGRSGALYVAIADGLGSRQASQLGAHLFTESVLIAAAEAESADGSPVTAALLLAEASVRTARVLTEAYRIEAREAACVGAVAVLSARGCELARIGDVAGFTLAGGEFAEVFPVESGFINVVSATLPGERPEQVETAELGLAEIVVLGTDGLANDLRNSAALRSWLAGRWRVPQWPFAMGDTLRYRRQGSHDDRTAVVVWRTAAPPSTESSAAPSAGQGPGEADDGTG